MFDVAKKLEIDEDDITRFKKAARELQKVLDTQLSMIRDNKGNVLACMKLNAWTHKLTHHVAWFLEEM